MRPGNRNFAISMPKTVPFEFDPLQATTNKFMLEAKYDTPFMAMAEKSTEWASQGINPYLMARVAQFASGICLRHDPTNQKNLYGWALEETERHNRKQGEI